MPRLRNSHKAVQGGAASKSRLICCEMDAWISIRLRVVSYFSVRVSGLRWHGKLCSMKLKGEVDTRCNVLMQ